MWWFVAIFVVSLVIGYAAAPRPRSGGAASSATKPSDLQVPTSQVGIAIPVLFGARDIKAPNILWYGDTKVKRAQANPKPYKYYAGMHLGLCLGPIDSVDEIQIGEKRVRELLSVSLERLVGLTDGDDVEFSDSNLFGGLEQEGGVAGIIRMRFGYSDQSPDPYLVTHLGAQAPGYRGVATAVIEQSYLGTSPYLKPWQFRASRMHVRQDGIEQWNDEQVEIIRTIFEFEEEWKYQFEPSGSLNDFSDPDYDDSGWAVGQAGFGNVPAGDPALGIPEANTVLGFVIQAGDSIWLRKNLGPIAPKQLDIYVIHDDGFELWINGQFVANQSSGNAKYISYFRHVVRVPAHVFSEREGDSILALKVTDSVPEGNPTYIFADCRAQEVPRMNPIHIIRECLTDPDWGMGYEEADIDDASFLAAAQTMVDEVSGMCLLWDRTTTIEDFIQEILRHIDATLFVSRDTGQFSIKLIRDDYDEGALLVLDESNIDKIDNYSRVAFGELVNSVTVKFWNSDTGREDSVSVHDTALVQEQGGVIDTEVEYPGLTNPDDASKAAARDLRTLSSASLSVTLFASQEASDLVIGDVFKLSWEDYGISETVMRVTGIAYGDGRRNRARITAIEDAFGTPEGVYNTPPGTSWIEPSSQPTPTINYIVAERPWHTWVEESGKAAVDAALASDNTQGRLFSAAKRPTGAISSSMWTDIGTGYVETGGLLDFCGGGKLEEDINATDVSIEYITATDMEDVVAGMYLQCEEEIMHVVSHNTASDTLVVERGVLDTVPVPHAANEDFLVWSESFVVDSIDRSDGDSVDVKLRTSAAAGVLDLADAPTDTVELDQRAARPYPPGNLEINSESYSTSFFDGMLTISWAHRSRVDQVPPLLVPHDDATDYGPEVGQDYTFRGYEDGVLQITTASIAGTSTTWTPSTSCLARVEVVSVLGGLESQQAATHEFVYGDVLITEDDDTMVTEADETRIV